MNGYNFTEHVRHALAKAREESAQLSHEYCGTEHILLGLIAVPECKGSAMLLHCGIDEEAVRNGVEGVVQRGRSPSASTDMPYTSRAKKVLELSMSEARLHGHTYVGTEHLLIGLLREEKGIAAQVLGQLGMSVDRARSAMSATGSPARAPQWPSVPVRLGTVFTMAQVTAVQIGADEVKPGHVALALLEHAEGLANAALDRLQCDRALVKQAIANGLAAAHAPAAMESRIPPSSRTSAVLLRMDEERTALRSPAVGTQHLLIALLECAPDVADAFRKQEIDAERVRAEVRRISG